MDSRMFRNRWEGRLVKRCDRACWLTLRGEAHNRASVWMSRTISFTPPTCRQIISNTKATITINPNDRSRSPRLWK